MSLHDDVADLVTDMWCEDPPDEKDMADKLINKVRDYYGFKDPTMVMIGAAHEVDIRTDERVKVLDEVDRKIDAEGGEFDPSDDLEKGYDDGLAAALKAVKQLRDES